MKCVIFFIWGSLDLVLWYLREWTLVGASDFGSSMLCFVLLICLLFSAKPLVMGDEQSSTTLGDSLNTAASAGQVMEMPERVSVLDGRHAAPRPK